MKKITSICLALVLVFSICSVFAVAKGSVNLAQGEGVTLTGAPTYNDGNSNYSGDLLDNQVGTDDYNNLWAGFYNNKTSAHNNYDGKNGIVVMDLGKVYANIDTVEAHIWDSKGLSGIASPAHIYISASVDGETYTDLGELTFGAEAIDWATLTLSSPINARYIKYNFDKGSNGGVFMFVSELAVWGDGSEANTAPVLTWKDNWTNDPEDEDPSDGVNLIFDNAYDYTFNINYVDGVIAGEDNTIITSEEKYNACNPNWAISVLLKPTATAGTYEVAAPAVVTPGSAANGLAAGINFENGNIVLVAHSSYSHDAGTNYTSKLCAIALKVGDKVVISDDKTTAYVPVPAGGVQTIKEEITVDGDLTDTGWAADKWIEVDGNNGFWQNPLPWAVENGQYPDHEFKYQLRTDDTKLYVAVEVNCDLVEGGNGNGTNVRFWINTNDEATVYTHFYDVFKKDGAVAYNAKYNKSTTANDGANTENSTIVPAITTANGKTYVEFSVDLAEFNGAEGFNYFICVSNNPVGDDTPNVCLYYPAVPLGPITESHDGPEHVPYKNLPYVTWHRDTQATVDVEAIKLGEVVISGGTTEPEEEADTSLMGDAPTASFFTATVSGPEAWKAGDKVTVDVTIEVTEDELALSQIMFNLFYDAADLEFVAGEELGAVNVTTGADSWKGEDSMLTASVDGAYGKLEVGLASVEEADALKKGDKIVVSFEFTVKEDAEGLINFQLSNEELVGYTYDDPATPIAGTGSSLAIAPAGDDLGDAGIYAIAALAIVALIGTAVVIKRRA